MGEVETQLLVGDVGSCLDSVRAEDLAQGGVEEVGRRVVPRDPLPPLRVDPEASPVTNLEVSLENLHLVDECAVRVLLHVQDLASPLPAEVLHPADIGNLSAGLGVERRYVEDDRPEITANIKDLDDVCIYLSPLVSDELGSFLPGVNHLSVDGSRDSDLRCQHARPLALAPHRRPEPQPVDGDSALNRDLLGQLQGKPVRVVEFERNLAWDDLLLRHGESLQDLLQAPLPARQGPAEGLLLVADHPLGESAPSDDLGIRPPEGLDDREDEPRQGPFLQLKPFPRPNGAAQDPPQDVPLLLVPWEDPVRHEKDGPPQVVGDEVPARPILRTGRPRHRAFDRLDDRAEEVDLEVGRDPLQDGARPLEAHPGVDVLLLERDEAPVLARLVLHEDEVPDLGEPVAVARDPAARRAAGLLFSPVVEDLAVRAARAGVPDRAPPVVLLAQAVDPLGRDPDPVTPDPVRLVVVLVDGDRELLLGDAQLLRHEPPGKVDRAFLEVVAEGEVPQHLEERMVGRRLPDVLNIRRPEALLAGRDARKAGRDAAPEDLLELDHPRRREQERRVVRDKRGTGQPLVPPRGEVVKIRFPKLVGSHDDPLKEGDGRILGDPRPSINPVGDRSGGPRALDPPVMPRVERVAKTVADEVRAQNGQEDEQPREEGDVDAVRVVQELLGPAEHVPPRDGRSLDA